MLIRGVPHYYHGSEKAVLPFGRKSSQEKHMVYQNKRTILNLLITLSLLVSCTELGDTVVIEYEIYNDRDFSSKDLAFLRLTKESLGKAKNCLTRKSEFGLKSYFGICALGKRVTIYRSFKNSFSINEKGISNEVTKSEGMLEMLETARQLETFFEKNDVIFKKIKPVYKSFSQLKELYGLYR